jgi:hypothetical protein
VTNDNKKKNIAAEVSRGDDSLRSARLLLNASLLADAVSRAYYAAFHYARALLLTAGEEPRTHGGVDRLLQRDFVREGTIDAKTASLFARLQKFRAEADYTAEFVFTAETAAAELASAESFVTVARQLLVDGGWIAK